MSTKAKKAAKPTLPAVEDDERHSQQVDDFVSRNHVALNASLREARAELAAGNVSKKSIGDIIVEGRRRHRRSA